MNWHFPTPYPLNIFRQHFYAIFFDNIFRPGTGFYPLIKCIQYSLLLIENYSQRIFYKIRHNLTQFDMHIVYTAIFPHKMSKLVLTCQSTLRFVEACKSYFFPSLSLYPYIWKLFKESFNKFIQNSTLLL